MDTDGDNANANETKEAQEGIFTDASASSTNANADVKSEIKSDETPPLIEGSSSSSPSSSSSSPSSSESDRVEMERVPLQRFVYRGNPATLGQRFSDWLEIFDLTSEANGIKNEQSKAYFLTNIGEELLDVYRSKRKDEKMVYDDIRKMLVEHTKPKTVVFTERAIFRRAKRHEGESVVDFATRLRTLVRYCGYKDAQLEDEILQQFVSGIGNHAVEMKICSLDKPTLESAIEIAVTAETLDANVKGLHGPTEREFGKRTISRLAEEEDEAEEETVNHLGQGPRSSGQAQRGGQRYGPPVNRPDTSSQQHGQQSCGNCGYAKHQVADQCPAIGKTCRICQKVNHFSRACRSEKAKRMENGTAGAFGGAGASQAGKPSTAEPSPKKFHQVAFEEKKKFEVDEQQYSEFIRYVKASQWMGSINQKAKGRLNGGPRRTYHLFGTEIHCIVDTGAPINVIDEATLKTISPQPKLETCNTLYFPYGEGIDKPIPIIGQFVANIHYKGRSLPARFVVVRGQEERLMCYHTAVELGIISMDNDRAIHSVGDVNASASVSSTSGAPESSMGKHGVGLKTSKTSSRETREALRDVLGRHDSAPYSRSSNRIVLGSDRSSEIPSVETERPETREKPKQRRVRDSVVTAVRLAGDSPAFELFRRREVEDPGASAQGKSGSPESSISKRREEATPRSSEQPDKALEASNQLHETNGEPQRVEQAMPQVSVQEACKKRGRPPAEERERRRKEREAALAADALRCRQ